MHVNTYICIYMYTYIYMYMEFVTVGEGKWRGVDARMRLVLHLSDTPRTPQDPRHRPMVGSWGGPFSY